jgi:hypothetical protein
MSIRVIKFWTNYTPGPDGLPKGVDMVMYAPIGHADKTTLVEAVSRLGKLHPIEMAADNPAVAMAHDIWNIIKPSYDAWKHGQKLPEVGTPLAAWPGVSSDQADALKIMGVRSVEEFANASDGVINSVPFPGARELKIAAGQFLKSADRQAITNDLKQKDGEIATLKEQLEEMRQMFLESQGIKADEPKRRGRPAKSEEAAA